MFGELMAPLAPGFWWMLGALLAVLAAVVPVAVVTILMAAAWLWLVVRPRDQLEAGTLARALQHVEFELGAARAAVESIPEVPGSAHHHQFAARQLRDAHGIVRHALEVHNAAQG